MRGEVEHRLVLGQEAVDSKSNEITAIPALLAGLDLSGGVVTIDAAGCQKAITQTILEQQADYVLTVKGNQPRTLQAVETWFTEHAFAVPAAMKPVLDAFDEHHGRLTRRRVFVHSTPTELNVLQEWPGIQSILAVESIRMVKPHGGITAEKRFFLSSLPSDDERQIAAIRQHWSIENSLHSRVGCHVSGRYVPSPRAACPSQSRFAEKNRHQSDTPQYDHRQCPRKTKTGRLE